MLNPISIKIAIIFLFLPDYLLAAAHLIYFQKLRLDMIKRRRAMLLCAVGFWVFLLLEMTLCLILLLLQ